MKQKYYQADEFIYDTMPDPMDVAVDKKVSLLYDLCILCKSKRDPDTREAELRKILSQYNSEWALTSALRDVVLGNKPLNTFLAQKKAEQENILH